MGRGSLEDLRRLYFEGSHKHFWCRHLWFQAIKPLYEAYVDNQSGFTRIVSFHDYMEEGLEDFQQYTRETNQLAIAVGRAFNMSPMKLEYVLMDMAEHIGGYILSLIDAVTKACYWQGHHTPRIDQLPLLKRILASEVGAGVQQQFL